MDRRRFLKVAAAGAALPLLGPPRGVLARQTQRRHPYLYFAADDLPAIRERIRRAPFDLMWERVLGNADRFLTRPVSTTEQILARNLAPMGVAGISAFAYQVTGERKYGERALQEARACMAIPRWHRGRGRVRGMDLPASHATMTCAMVYDWCYDLMSAEERTALRRDMEQKALRVYMRSLDEYNDPWVRDAHSNWNGVCNGASGVTALALHDESEIARDAAERAWEEIRWFITHFNGVDGAGLEGPMYWRYGNQFASFMAVAASRFYGDDRGAFQELTDKLAGYWMVYTQGPDGRYANFGNMNEHVFAGLYSENPGAIEGGPDSQLAALFESHAPGGDALLRWAADNGGSNAAWFGVSPFTILWRREAPPAGPRPELDEAALFRGCGHAIFQSPDLWFAYQGGRVLTQGHWQQDLGSFILVAHGERLVHHPDYLVNSNLDHSTITPNGRGQPLGSEAEYRRFGSGRGFHWLASDLVNAYPGAFSRWVRHAVMVDGAYVVLLDDLLAQQPETSIEWRLQSRLETTADPAARTATVRGESARLHIIEAAPRDGEISAQLRPVERGRGTRELYTTIIRPPTGRTDQSIATVLFPAAPGQRPPAARFADGRLTVRGAGRDDTILFTMTEDGWMLQSVNGADASGVPDGSRRMLTLFRPMDAGG